MTKGFAFQRSLCVLNPDLLRARAGSETLVVFGAARGMTSAVGYALYALGVPMGDEMGPRNYEDRAFQAALPRRLWLQRLSWPRAGLRRLIAQRNAAHPRWGFKLPHAGGYVPVLSRLLRKPVFVICIRNPLSTMASVQRHETRAVRAFATLYARSLDYLGGMEWLLRRRDVPAILINMDAVQRDPALFMQEFAALLGLEGDLDRIAAEIARPGYSTRTEQP